MARRRMLDPSIWDDEDLGSLSVQERLLFISSVSHADDWGKLPGSAAALKKVTFGFDNYSIGQVLKWRNNLAATVKGYHVYEIDGKEYVSLLRWHKYQRVDKPQPSTIPDPIDAEFDPSSKQNSSENDSKNGSESHSARKEGRKEGHERKQGSKEEIGADAPCPPAAPDDHPVLRPLAVAYCQQIVHVTNTQARQELNQTSLEYEAHELYDEETWIDAIESFARSRLSAYRQKHNSKFPPLSYICRAIANILEEQKRGKAA